MTDSNKDTQKPDIKAIAAFMRELTIDLGGKAEIGEVMGGAAKEFGVKMPPVREAFTYGEKKKLFRYDEVSRTFHVDTQEDLWVEESFYFGNANYPSDATYRSRGNRKQKKVEKSLVMRDVDGRYGYQRSEPEGVTEFLNTYLNCEFLLADGHEIRKEYGGGRTKPVLWLVGWYELTTPEDFEYYERDKEAAWK